MVANIILSCHFDIFTDIIPDSMNETGSLRIMAMNFSSGKIKTNVYTLYAILFLLLNCKAKKDAEEAQIQIITR